jgi:hypothetical protein
MSDKQSFPVRYLRSGLWRVHPALAQSTSFARGVNLVFRRIPKNLHSDAIAEAYPALLEHPEGLPEADALRIVDREVKRFVRAEQRERGEVRRSDKPSYWRKALELDRLVAPDDPARTVEREQAALSINVRDLLRGRTWEELLALELLNSPHAKTRSVRNVMQATTLSRRQIAALKVWRDRTATGLELPDPGEGHPAVMDLPRTAATDSESL